MSVTYDPTCIDCVPLGDRRAVVSYGLCRAHARKAVVRAGKALLLSGAEPARIHEGPLLDQLLGPSWGNWSDEDDARWEWRSTAQECA